VNYASPMTTGSLVFTPVSGSGGTATITVTVDDGQSQNNTVSRTFTVTVAGPDPFASVLGNYNGLFYEDDAVRLGSAGFLSVSVAAQGVYSGYLEIGNSTYSLSGQMSTDLKATNVVSQGANTLTIAFGVGQDQLTGTVTDGNWTATLLGDRAVFAAGSNPAPYAGRYTIALPGAGSNPSAPNGNGYGTVLVDANGMITFGGILADGTAVSQTVPVSKNGQWPLFIPLYSGKGCLVSWLTFTNLPNSDVSGPTTWISPDFTNESACTGSLYIEPASAAQNVITSTNATISFAGADLPDTFTNVVSFGLNSAFLNWSTNDMALTITRNNGVFSGTMTDPATGTFYAFGGVVLQKTGNGLGFFLGHGLSGQVSLQPAGAAPAPDVQPNLVNMSKAPPLVSSHTSLFP